MTVNDPGPARPDHDPPLTVVGRPAEREQAPAEPGQGASPVLLTDLASKTLAVKDAETFLYSDLEGNLDHGGDIGLGLYARDTRFLSQFRMTMNGRDLVLLSSSAERGYMAHVDLTNPDLFEGEDLCAPQQTINVRRVRAIRGSLFERIRIKNYNAFEVTLEVDLRFGADFADIFEIRGMTERRSAGTTPAVEGSEIAFEHEGRDGVRRTTRIRFGLEPDRIDVEGDLATASFRIHLDPHQTRLLTVTVDPDAGGERAPSAPDFDHAVHELRRSYEEWERESTRIVTDNELFNELLDRSLRDLRALYTRVNGSGVLAAGIPWYVTIFGRDSLIAAHQFLTVNTRPAREALQVLAERQGTEINDWRDEQPGKILHEVREGELARAGILPHSPYYGSVDSTPWFVIVYAQHLRWTGDLAFARELLPAAEAAMRWIDEFGDLDGDGFVEYLSRSPRGIRNQGWKDSHDAIVHADGEVADPPIALAEVQGYVYLAKTRMADVYRALGRPDEALRLEREAERLKTRFNEAFWMEEERFFAGALDADKRQVRTLMSNPGHCLYCGIVDEDKALPLAKGCSRPTCS